MSRARPEWIGRTPNTAIPPRVRERIFDRDNGICHLCKLSIKPGETWDADHVLALINGGENRERNIAPAHKHCHVGKSVIDLKTKAKIAKVRQKHIGVKRPAGNIKSPGFPSTARKERVSKKALEPRQLFEKASP